MPVQAQGVKAGGLATTAAIALYRARGGAACGGAGATQSPQALAQSHPVAEVQGGVGVGGEARAVVFNGGVACGGEAASQFTAGSYSKNQQHTKIKDLHEYLLHRVAQLKRNPEQLLLFVDNGRVEFYSGSNYSHVYHMPLRLVITDWRGTLDELTLPLLEWLSVREPGFNPATALTFDAQMIDHETLDISYTLNISERVIVAFDGTNRTINHVLPGPPVAVTGPLAIHVNGPAGGFELHE